MFYKKIIYLIVLIFTLLFAAACGVEYEVNVEIESEEIGEVIGAGSYSNKEEVTIEAVPKEGYAFDKWVENDEIISLSKELQFKIKEDRNLTAVFSEKITNATLLAVGDVMVHQTQYLQAYDEKKNKYDFSPSFEFISSYFKDADLVVGNLETTLAGEERGFRAYPRFNSPDEIAYDLKEAGMDLMSTANNHSLDSGEQGLYRTLEVLEDAGLKAFGTARNQKERDTPTLVNVEGIKLAFLSYTFGTNMIPVPEGKDYIVNLIDKNLITKDIEKAKENGADLIVLFLHWGIEYQSEPNEEQKNLARDLAKAGADIILGSHPHVIQPVDYIQVANDEGEINNALVIYSLGNFMSNQHKTSGVPTNDVKYGLMLQVDVAKNHAKEEAYIADLDYTITWVHRSWRHRIIPLDKLLYESPERYNLTAGQKDELLHNRSRMLDRIESYRVNLVDLIS